MSITHLAIVSVPVSDQDRARDFYVDTLGFELIADSPMGPDQRWVQVGPKGSQTSLTLVTWFESMPAGSVKGLVLECDDVRATHDELSSRGVTFTGPIEEQFWGTFSTFDDPDGNGWVLQQAPSERSNR
jgi:catechol 2,3-dioxygenase-like lactoylglutathione lyase family enzyme